MQTDRETTYSKHNLLVDTIKGDRYLFNVTLLASAAVSFNEPVEPLTGFNVRPRDFRKYS